MTNRKVLIVDDERSLLDVLGQYLQDEGFDVIRASDGLTAVELFSTRHPDLVVLDLHLPGLPGTEVLKRIRAERDVPIIMLTARTDEIDRVVGLELGADDYIGKPFSPREVVARVKSVLRRSERADEARSASEQRVGGIGIDPGAHEGRGGGT